MQACDVIVVPYDASQEGASGSASICLAARRPVVASDSAVFSSIRHVTYPLSETDPKSIADAVTQLLCSPGLQEDYQRRAASYVADHAWPVVAREFLRAIAGARLNSHERLPQLEVAR